MNMNKPHTIFLSETHVNRFERPGTGKYFNYRLGLIWIDKQAAWDAFAQDRAGTPPLELYQYDRPTAVWPDKSPYWIVLDLCNGEFETGKTFEGRRHVFVFRSREHARLYRQDIEQGKKQGKNLIDTSSPIAYVRSFC